MTRYLIRNKQTKKNTAPFSVSFAVPAKCSHRNITHGDTKRDVCQKKNTNKKTTPKTKKIPSNFSTLFATFFSDPFMLKRSTHVTTQRQHTVYTTDSSDQCDRAEPPLQRRQKRPSLSTATLTVQFSSVLTHYLLHQGWATF